MPFNPWYSIRAESDSRVAAVAVRGSIGEFGLTDEDFVRDLQAAGEVDEIRVTINSRGGEVDHALAIYDALRTHPARVTVRITGMAASAASIIAMAGDEIRMPANALMMVHNPWTIALGDAEALRQAAAGLDKVTSSLVETYRARTDKTEDEIRALLDDETWLTADEAVEMGFADTVEPIKTKALNALADAVQIPAAVLAKLERIEQPDIHEPDPVPAPVAAAQAQLEALADADPELDTAIPAQPDPIPSASARSVWAQVISKYDRR